MTSRRDFLKTGGVAARRSRSPGGAPHRQAAVRRVRRGDRPRRDGRLGEGASRRKALNAAKLAGAGYADARIGRYLQNFVVTREQQIINVVDTDSIRDWHPRPGGRHVGFAASRDLTTGGVAAAAREAVAIAKAIAWRATG
ncbi:MAG: hypothetical protein IPK33_25770 [Gemmatimonadetes bacterium]|nr:hypothetical protein [Gemmatimonadota bacterium]